MLQGPIFRLPGLLSVFAQGKVSAERVAKYLQEEELKCDAVTDVPRSNTCYDVEIDHGTFSWDIETTSPTLTNIELQVKRGMKVAICGMVGSGKSSLLSCILGEIPKRNGTVRVSGSKAYIPQTAWILSGNIRENILFGNPYDKEKYERIIQACALTKDLDLLANGDLTEIGERGINMSGGQKQRIQIARSVYEDADIYLFDDPFSAVDAHTGSQIFQDGKIVQTGNFDELHQQNIGFEPIVGAYSQALESVMNAESGSRRSSYKEKSAYSDDELNAENETDDQLLGMAMQESAHEVSQDTNDKGKLTQDEEREKGGIDKKVYWAYLKTAHGGVFVPVVIIGARLFFQIFQVQYAEHLPSILRNISCTIPGRKKVGIVGRTGSGKSTLINALFRIIEPREGTIEIDNVDICKIGLHDLRGRLSIIPQDPTMFEGTVRGNLDPLNEYPDQHLWEVLDKCQLGDIVRKSPKKLDSSVAENGENWSVGQRQLFCLGRVLLKRSNILVLDEATASVDSSTDAIIKEIIHQEFGDCTVLTIAHRIHTVIDNDLILVLSEGRIVEYDTPSKLLMNENSEFSKLVKEYSRRYQRFSGSSKPLKQGATRPYTQRLRSGIQSNRWAQGRALEAVASVMGLSITHRLFRERAEMISQAGRLCHVLVDRSFDLVRRWKNGSANSTSLAIRPCIGSFPSQLAAVGAAVRGEGLQDADLVGRAQAVPTHVARADDVRILEALVAHHRTHGGQLPKAPMLFKPSTAASKGRASALGSRELNERQRSRLKRRYDRDAMKVAPPVDEHGRRLYLFSRHV
nr:unnamed protein product [Digitaria exilis]